MKSVGAALDDLIDDRAGVAGKLRVHGAGDDVFLLKRVGIHFNAFALQGDIVDVCAVQDDIVLRGLAAIGGVGTKIVGGFDDAGLKFLQSRGIAPLHRYAFKLARGNHLL